MSTKKLNLSLAAASKSDEEDGMESQIRKRKNEAAAARSERNVSASTPRSTSRGRAAEAAAGGIGIRGDSSPKAAAGGKVYGVPPRECSYNANDNEFSKLKVELVKMKKDVEQNKQTTKRFYNQQRSIVDNSGSLVVSASAIDRIGHGMMDASALDFFLKIIQASAHERIAIFPINFMQKILDDASCTANDTNRMFRRYEQRNGWEDIFHDANQLHFPILHSVHYSVISITKLQEQHTTSDCDYYHRIYAKCSLGKDMDHLVRQLLTAIQNYYVFKGKQFHQDQWHRPMGRGARRCAKQGDNGLNCGLFVCFNVEMMTKIKVTCPTFHNDDGPMYRNHILQKIMQFVETHNDYSMLEVRSSGRGGGKRLKTIPRTQMQGQGSPGIIDLTGGNHSDEE